ncbi:sensor histidine kinase [Streptacidiphilus sp. ASG 303]|uniref:sensor histidine kinase n=1 Tax=Streptacidiphilus sp. ASG 303 TaxID=2896847 RepID=UPI001E571636|nr:sensor histidine kinase [Streptacidiphilus sp. ASG 303]MCD0485195.1 sensor histidine kinase [Streptacidiphilus sp. ASG 303]
MIEGTQPDAGPVSTGPPAGGRAAAVQVDAAPERTGFAHPALFYRDQEDFLAGVGGFVREGLEAGEPVLVAVPGPRLGPLRERLGDCAAGVSFADMAELGRNPGRILAALREFADAGGAGRTRMVGEPIWASRSPAEVREATRHEALINLAFRDRPVSVLCPYDTDGLEPYVIEDALRTHPEVIRDGLPAPSAEFADPAEVCADCDTVLAEPAAAEELSYASGGLAEVRRWLDERLAATGLDRQRRGDLVLAVGEAAGNSVVHGGGRGVLRVWPQAGSVVAEVRDAGRLADLLAGRRRPGVATADGGRGLWMIHQLCDLVEVRSDDRGLTLRLHVDVGPGAP